MRDDLVVRDAVEADLREMAEIYNHAILNTTGTFDTVPKTVEQWRKMLSNASAAYPLIVAAIGDMVVGWGALKPLIDRPAARFSTENAVYVDPSSHGKGIGTALMEELVARARIKGYHAIIAFVVSGNEASERLHEKLGFERVGFLREVGHKFDRWLDLIVYEKLI